ncbi:RHS repeat domain-containing protein [Luteibacter yeojuensis]|uniref:RHS repeat protein n=1 Tax=Luteibacter yeojuensis TaxID=345309 RepID=A0A7X5TSD1_9GAMM|nr:RHS repeat domain-containing protein [Luteibacter yeojuensis]NID17237.1 RHS repeat protein [Luteibacter yeojuensis]
MGASRRSRTRDAVFACVLGMMTTAVTAQSVSIESEWKKLLRVNEDIQPLGPDAFGESISTYDGSLSFRQVDLEAKGNGLPIIVERTIHARPVGGPNAYVFELAAQGFTDWDMTVPQLETLSAETRFTDEDGHDESFWYFIDEPQRCTRFYGAGTIDVPTKPGEDGVMWTPNQWWHGIQLKIPGAGAQDVLQRDPGNNNVPQMTRADGSAMPFTAVTRQNWALGCENTAGVGETFVAVAPDGTRYWLDRLSWRPTSTLAHPGGGALKRRVVTLQASRAEDRFGRRLSYSYDANNRLTSITADDGRSVTFTYAQWQHSSGLFPVGERITTVTQHAATGDRTWTYTYGGTADEPVLASVTLPNSSSWSFSNMKALATGQSAQPDKLRVDYEGCVYTAGGTPVSDVATLTHPSGLTGTFTLTSVVRGRSNVPRRCILDRGVNIIQIPHAYVSSAISQKHYTGAGVDQLWSFTYSPANASWNTDCTSGCTNTVWTQETDPDGSRVVHTFSNQWGSTETLLKREDTYPVGGVNPTRSEITEYAAATAGPWPSRLGDNLQGLMNHDQTEMLSPVSKRTLLQDGDTYQWQVASGSFDVFARPLTVNRGTVGMAGQSTRTERTTYNDDLAHWVLGQTRKLEVIEPTATTTVSETIFDALARPTERKSFGRTVMTYGWNGGDLASFTDGNAHTTSLSNYRRGIPQLVTYPDTHTQTAVVDDLGQIVSATDQRGVTTGYHYDGIGRLTQVDYQTEANGKTWAPKIFTYEFVGSEPGIAGSHWRRTVTHHDRADIQRFDALLHPISSEQRRASDGALTITTLANYDWRGNQTFASYPIAGSAAYDPTQKGVRHIFDALGRETSSTRDAGDDVVLTTGTAYLSGARRKFTDPRGNEITTTFQVFDAPSYEQPLRVQAPEGVDQVIDRTIFGDVLAIHQMGADPRGEKLYKYDAFHRACRVIEPETGNTVMQYDGADNVVQTARGIAVSGDGCLSATDMPAGSTVVRSFDAMNRLTSVAYPDGSPSVTLTYDGLGNPATAQAGVDTIWSYARNNVNLMSLERLQVDGRQWDIAYDYDAKGALSAITYPDGKIVGYTPDALGRATQAGTYATAVSYFPDGNLESFAFGSGAAYFARENDRMTLQDFTYGTAAATVIDQTLTYDRTDNITHIEDHLGGGQRSKTFTYDALNRLVTAESVPLWGKDTYHYDVLNNITGIDTLNGGVTTGRTYTYGASNRLDSITTTDGVTSSYAYDVRGNVTSRAGQVLAFDLADRLSGIAGIADYAYDANGRRVKQTPAGAVLPKYSAYSASGQLMWEYNPSTQRAKDYIYLGKKLVAAAENVHETLIGFVGGVTESGVIATLNGWACSQGSTDPVPVEVFIDGPAGTGTPMGSPVLANKPSSATDTAMCGTGGTAYGFAITIPEAVRLDHAGAPIYVVAHSNIGGPDQQLANSGVPFVPASASAPDTPASATAVVAGDLASITVSWAASARTTAYQVEKQFNGGAWSSLYTGTNLSTVFGGPADGNWTFRVRACVTVNCSIEKVSNTVTVAHIPPAPATISVPATSNGPITVSWSAATYAATYHLEQSINGGAWTLAYSGAATSKALTVGVTGTYTYRVTGCNGSGVCGPYKTSGGVVVTIPPSGTPSISAPAAVHNGAWTVSWSGVAGATRYALYERYNGGGWGLVQNTAAGSWPTSNRPDGSYNYYVNACNAGGCGPNSAVVTVTVTNVPPAPTNVHAVDAFSGSHETLTITWNATPGATYHEVLRNNTTTTWHVNMPTLKQLVETGPIGEIILYGYQVRACNAYGCSAWVSAT